VEADFPLLLTAAEMRAADLAIARALGVPTSRLMENAGRGVAEVVRHEVAETPGEVLVVCGAGSNGGDGFVAARHLAAAGRRVLVLLAAPRAKIQGDAAAALAALEEAAVVPVEDGSGWADEKTWHARLARPGAHPAAIVDAIFGTGFRGPLRDVPAAAIAAMNAAQGHKIAVDVPSGLDADTGRAAGAVFRADITATMGARKLGLCLEASAPVGRVALVDLGAPVDGSVAPDARCWLLDAPGIAARLPRRSADAHKGSKGHLLVVAGSAGKTGAAFLTGTAALRSGAGLVTLASTAAGQSALDAKAIELMTARYAEGDDAVPETALAALEALAARARAVAIGPGIPTGAGMRAVVHHLAARLALPMVIDADALNALGPDAAGILAGAPAPRVLTPHPGEMGRLLGMSIGDVQADRLGHARRLSAAAHAVVVLKGARTVVAAPDGAAFVNPAATSALATAGSGDVLTGVVGALLARGLEALTAAQVGVYLHGAAGEALALRLGDGVMAGDLPLAIAELTAHFTG
jgi:ADP-dependent NAD(P)H-hydrate dehydratase / NAD(P)H-hydrate epimerase